MGIEMEIIVIIGEGKYLKNTEKITRLEKNQIQFTHLKKYMEKGAWIAGNL